MKMFNNNLHLEKKHPEKSQNVDIKRFSEKNYR